ncbi:hypothetical protein TPAR_05291 [Tolypocladium paradoxum]|uniref:Uncharacterized protein n=1 Tax=Tolypocladium paradoxum TaxID=94208 RepID=A0A2S4KWH4_9HYPO|nr:hypothetical protein TPAR_05291 [Tolypocladium paradoxum]
MAGVPPTAAPRFILGPWTRPVVSLEGFLARCPGTGSISRSLWMTMDGERMEGWAPQAPLGNCGHGRRQALRSWAGARGGTRLMLGGTKLSGLPWRDHTPLRLPSRWSLRVSATAQGQRARDWVPTGPSLRRCASFSIQQAWSDPWTRDFHRRRRRRFNVLHGIQTTVSGRCGAALESSHCPLMEHVPASSPCPLGSVSSGLCLACASLSSASTASPTASGTHSTVPQSRGRARTTTEAAVRRSEVRRGVCGWLGLDRLPDGTRWPSDGSRAVQMACGWDASRWQR